MKYFCLLALSVITLYTTAQTQVSGYVTDQKNGESLIGVSIYTSGKKSGTTTNAYGFFSLQASAEDSIYIQYMGYAPQQVAAQVSVMHIRLAEETGTLKEAVVHAARTQATPGHTVINIKEVNLLPAMGGERDLVKALQLMPGIKKGADGTASMLVRGGAHDQNLILLDDAPVYNPTHLLGFFSLFNTDAVNSATLQTGGFSAHYGGRLSSVLDIHTIDGNSETFSGNVSAGLLASRISLQAPLPGHNGSVFIAGRISYVNKVFELAGRNLPFYFYDLNAKLHYRLGVRDKLFLSAYTGDDVLNESASDSAEQINIASRMGNAIASLRWNHAFKNPKLFSNTTLFLSRYRYHIHARISDNTLRMGSDIADAGVRYAWQQQVNPSLSLRYGTEFIQHTFQPNSTRIEGSFNENIKAQQSTRQRMQEAALYLSGLWYITEHLSTEAGFRYSGAHSGNAFYTNPEPRLRADYQLNSRHQFSVSYAKMVQYMFLLSGSSAVLPTDLWYGVSSRIRPQQAHIITAGYQYTRSGFSTKAEVYYKPMQQLVEYREGTTELINGEADRNVIQGKGKAWGMELTTRFTSGKWNATIGYTLSWTTRTFAELNEGHTFFDRYDRRHDLSIVAHYELTPRMHFSAVWCYATGSRFTPVTGYFMMPNVNYSNIDLLPIYSGRNAIRLSASHRLDVNLVIKSRAGCKYQGEWHVGAYNVYNQVQPYRIKMSENADGSYSYKQTGLFGFIPSVSYQLHF